MSLQAAILTNACVNTGLASVCDGLLLNDGLLLVMAITRKHHQCVELIKALHHRSVSSTLLNKCIITAITSHNNEAATALFDYQRPSEQERHLDDYLKASIVNDNSVVLLKLINSFRLKVVARAGSLMSMAVENQSSLCLEELFNLRCSVDYKSVSSALATLLVRDTSAAISLINCINIRDMGRVAAKCFEADNAKAFRVAIVLGLTPSDVTSLFIRAAKNGVSIFVDDILDVYPELRDLSSIFLRVMLESDEYMPEEMVMTVINSPHFDKKLAPSYLAAALEQEMPSVVGHLLADPWLVVDRAELEPIVARRANSPAALLIQGDSRWTDGTHIVPREELGDIRPATSNGKSWIITGYNASKQHWIGIERCVGEILIPYNLYVGERVASHTYTSMKITKTSITLTGPEAHCKIPVSGLLTLEAVANPTAVLAAFSSIEQKRPKIITFKKYPILRSLRVVNVITNLRTIYGAYKTVDYDGDDGYTVRYL